MATPEISAHDPHHGMRPRGNPALQQALGRTQGSRADKIMGKYAAPEEVLELPGSCYACGVEGTTKMFQTSIPFFKVGSFGQQHPVCTACWQLLCLGGEGATPVFHTSMSFFREGRPRPPMCSELLAAVLLGWCGRHYCVPHQHALLQGGAASFSNVQRLRCTAFWAATSTVKGNN